MKNYPSLTANRESRYITEASNTGAGHEPLQSTTLHLGNEAVQIFLQLPQLQQGVEDPRFLHGSVLQLAEFGVDNSNCFFKLFTISLLMIKRNTVKILFSIYSRRRTGPVVIVSSSHNLHVNLNSSFNYKI